MTTPNRTYIPTTMPPPPVVETGAEGPPGSENWLWEISYWPESQTLRDPQDDDEYFIVDPQVIP